MTTIAGLICLAMGIALATAGMADSRDDYLLHCSGCHLPDGSGMPGEVPSLHDDLGRIVTLDQGREYLVRVPGASQAMLNDADLAGVINFVLNEFNSETLAADFKPLTAEEVARVRSDVLLHPAKFRAELWQILEGY